MYAILTILLAIACHQDLEIEQMNNVTNAFLNADIELNIYMDRLEGHEVFSDDRGRLVYHLRKLLYGIREAPRA
jgi:hypothetical protein